MAADKVGQVSRRLNAPSKSELGMGEVGEQMGSSRRIEWNKSGRVTAACRLLLQLWTSYLLELTLPSLQQSVPRR